MPESAAAVRVVNLRHLVFWALGIYLVYHFVESIIFTVLIFLIAFFFAIVMDPPIRKLDRRGFSRGASVAIIAITTLTIVAVVAYLALPPLIQEVTDLIANGPRYAREIQNRVTAAVSDYPMLREQIEREDFRSRLQQIGAAILPRVGRYSLGVLTGLLSLILIFIITLYTLANPGPLVRGIVRAAPRDYRRCVLRILARVSGQLQAWVRATFLLMVIIGVMSGIGLALLGVKSALLFAVIAGIGEAVPTIGPILSAIPPFAVTLAENPTKAVYVLILFFVVQQLENNLLVPRVMASTMNLHPVSVMFFVIAMGALLGPVGILLATPACATVKIIYEELYQRRIRRQPVHLMPAELLSDSAQTPTHPRD